MASSAASSYKALRKIGCNRLLKTTLVDCQVNSPMGFKQEFTNDLQKRLSFSTKIKTKTTSSRTLFERWCKKYGKTYASEQEKEHRLKVFDQTRKFVDQKHALGDYTVGFNGFADQTCEEVTKKCTMRGARRRGPLDLKHLGKGQAVECHSIEEWKEQLEKAVKSGKLVVLDFTKWLQQLRYIHPKFAKKATNVIFMKMNLDHAYVEMNISELETIDEEFKVGEMPTLLVLKEGKEVDRVEGGDPDVMEKHLHAILTEHGGLTP